MKPDRKRPEIPVIVLDRGNWPAPQAGHADSSTRYTNLHIEGPSRKVGVDSRSHRRMSGHATPEVYWASSPDAERRRASKRRQLSSGLMKRWQSSSDTLRSPLWQTSSSSTMRVSSFSQMKCAH